MRRPSNILMATLIVAALFCGNCLSCPQMWMAVATPQPGHSCCHHRTAKVDCPSQALSQFVKAQGGSFAPVFTAAGVAPAITAVTATDRPALASWRAADFAPPGPLSLHSLLRV
jgi:hypothetical protein